MNIIYCFEKTHCAAAKWEKDMRAKYMEGQVVEMLGKIMENVNNGMEFPSEPYHNWPKELMDHAKTGWRKYKTFMETLSRSIPGKIWNKSIVTTRGNGFCLTVLVPFKGRFGKSWVRRT